MQLTLALLLFAVMQLHFCAVILQMSQLLFPRLDLNVVIKDYKVNCSYIFHLCGSRSHSHPVHP